MKLHTLGFPRIGTRRELKFALEQYWQGRISKQEFLQTGADIRRQNWAIQQQAGIELLPVGDFANYDHVLNTSLYLGIIPQRFARDSDSSDKLDLEFRIARGRAPTGCACAASDMTKWFNTNYHYVVPELSQQLDIRVDIQPLLEQIEEAKNLGHESKPVLLGPLSYLRLIIIAIHQQLTINVNCCNNTWNSSRGFHYLIEATRT